MSVLQPTLRAGGCRNVALVSRGGVARCAAACAWLAVSLPAEAQFLGGAPCECRTVLSPPAVAPPPQADGDLTLDVHESLLNRVVSRTDQRQSPVRDFVLGADVHGVEATTTSIRIDLRPSNAGAAFDLVLDGWNRSETVGYTPQAAVRTLGQHRFQATKFVLHDGRLFRTTHPRVDVATSNQTLGASTPVEGVPFLGPAASSLAFQGAEAQRAAGEAIAAQKIRDGVGPEFNRRIDAELARLNRGWLHAVAPKLQQQGLDRCDIVARSTDEWAHYSVQWPNDRRAARSPAPATPAAPARSVTTRRIAEPIAADSVDPTPLGRLTVRDAPLNRALARLGLAGTTIRLADVAEPAEALQPVLKTLRQHGLEISAVPDQAAAALAGLSIRFDDRNPLQVRFENNQIVVAARAALALPPLVDLPVMSIVLRYAIDDADDDALSLVPAGVRFEHDASTATAALTSLLESQAIAALPTVRVPRRFRLPIPDGVPLDLSIKRIAADAGRLSLTVR